MRNWKYYGISVLLIAATTLFRGCTDMFSQKTAPEADSQETYVTTAREEQIDTDESDISDNTREKQTEEGESLSNEIVFNDLQKLLTLYALKDIPVKSGPGEDSRKVGVIEKGMEVHVEAVSEDGMVYRLRGGGYVLNDDALSDKVLVSEADIREEDIPDNSGVTSSETKNERKSGDKQPDVSGEDKEKPVNGSIHESGKEEERSDNSGSGPSGQEENGGSDTGTTEQSDQNGGSQGQNETGNSDNSGNNGNGGGTTTQDSSGITVNSDPNLLPGGVSTSGGGSEQTQTQSEERTYSIYINTDIFASVNSVRSSNGIYEYSWRSDKEEDAKTRAREIVDNFSHSSVSGISAYSECITWTGSADAGTILGSYSTSEIHYGTLTQSQTITGFVSANCDEYINGVYTRTYNVILLYD